MNRFHNKYHRHNHHTLSTTGEADSSHDPIASPSDPFKGDFHLLGQLSATSAVVSSLSVHGDSHFTGSVNITTSISTTFNHIKISPASTTPNHYFSIESAFNTHPFMEISHSGAPVFIISTNKNVGIGTNTPAAKLHVNGDVLSQNITSSDIFSSNISTNTLTAKNTAVLGFLQVSSIPNLQTILKTVSGNKDMFFHCGDNLNLVLSSNNTNTFFNKLGIGASPTENLTVVGQQSFKQNGYILFDNSHNNTLRIINNRDKIDDLQHFFTFASDGRYVVGNISHDEVYKTVPPPNSNWNKMTSHKISIFGRDNQNNLSLTNIAKNPGSNNGPTLRMFRSNGDLTAITSAQQHDNIGSIKAYGYNINTQFNEHGNAGVNFYAENNYDNPASQGGYVCLYTVAASDPNTAAQDRVVVSGEGNVGIYNFSATKTLPSSRLTVVNDINTTSEPTVYINSGTNCLTSVRIEGGIGIVNITNLQLSQLQSAANSTQSIDFTHSTEKFLCSKIVSTFKASPGGTPSEGSSLSFYTTDNCIDVPAYERAVISSKGNFGIGSLSPSTRLHVHGDDGTSAKGDTGGVVATFSSNGTSTGIQISSSTAQTNIHAEDNKTILTTAGSEMILNLDTVSADLTKPHIRITLGEIFYRTTAGAGTLTGGIPSDISIKTNIHKIKDSLNKIKNISGVTFNWNEEKQNDFKGKDIGVIAQEIEAIIPEAITASSDGYKIVKYYKIIPLLIECIKDLQVEIDKLKNK